ncbi:MAG: SMC-Scp complex subunit ScpB [Deltaproteobacteria bacterium]|nr:SMC-Scp complex subunit ScpB [Deltaproteobacteria bacterium]
MDNTYDNPPVALELKTIVEGLLLAADEPLNAEKLAAAFEEPPSEIELTKVLEELVQEYAQPGRGFSLSKVAGGYRFLSRPELGPHVIRLKKKAPARLSKAALETLAIIAYRQPVIRAEVEKIRGVDAGGVIKALLEKNLIKISGRRDTLPGKPILYGTTAKFLETFGLKDLKSLPTVAEIEKLCPPQPRLF